MIFDVGPWKMARRLAKRHSDIGFIRSYIISCFGHAPSREAIQKMREEATDRTVGIALRRERKSESRRRLERQASKRYRDKLKGVRDALDSGVAGNICQQDNGLDGSRDQGQAA